MHGRAVVTCNLSFFEINSTLTIDWKKIEYGVRSRCNAGNTHRLHTAHHAALDKSHMTHTTIGGGARKVAIIAADLHTLTHVVPVHPHSEFFTRRRRPYILQSRQNGERKRRDCRSVCFSPLVSRGKGVVWWCLES